MKAHLKATLGAVVPDETNIRRIHTCTNEHIKVLMNDVLHLNITQHHRRTNAVDFSQL